MGAWIETSVIADRRNHTLVAPYVGAWIETYLRIRDEPEALVAPYVGAWIETRCNTLYSGRHLGRSLRGSVD